MYEVHDEIHDNIAKNFLRNVRAACDDRDRYTTNHSCAAMKKYIVDKFMARFSVVMSQGTHPSARSASVETQHAQPGDKENSSEMNEITVLCYYYGSLASRQASDISTFFRSAVGSCGDFFPSGSVYVYKSVDVSLVPCPSLTPYIPNASEAAALDHSVHVAAEPKTTPYTSPIVPGVVVLEPWEIAWVIDTLRKAFGLFQVHEIECQRTARLGYHAPQDEASGRTMEESVHKMEECSRAVDECDHTLARVLVSPLLAHTLSNLEIDKGIKTMERVTESWKGFTTNNSHLDDEQREILRESLRKQEEEAKKLLDPQSCWDAVESQVEPMLDQMALNPYGFMMDNPPLAHIVKYFSLLTLNL
ncbi:unnamed protein product [Rhizoctonia solani]|uniref:Uncharacterized protein n=1 Tax=Rhizoctonia solani TaxID=456999 RepID=A0A8H2WAC3_9AGAM|nr:unnamed protein product [Rhizoctonia solani]